jgi:small subunit ribosomal protein S4e
MVTKGHNVGRVGNLVHLEKHDGSFSIVTVKDKKGNSFATRLSNVFIIGSGDHPQVTLPKGRGIKKTIIQERNEAEARGEL